MVFIEDREGIFDASIDKVWRLAQAHATEGSKIHPGTRNIVTEMLSENTFVNTWEQEMKGQVIRIKTKGTIFYPLGIAFEIIEGPFAGSKYFIYYIPREDGKTNVVAAGDFRSSFADPSVGENDDGGGDEDEAALKSMVLSTLEKVFEEDCEYLKNME